LAALWTLLGMRIFHIAFNPANLVIMPLLVGIGVDNGIHVVRQFLGGKSNGNGGNSEAAPAANAGPTCEEDLPF